MTRPILYHCPDARSLRCLWAVEEAGIDVDLRLLKFPPRAFEPDYRAVNPLMTIPGWVEDGRLMTESAAICERIAEGTSLEVRRGEAGHELAERGGEVGDVGEALLGQLDGGLEHGGAHQPQRPLAAIVANIFLQIPALSLTISALVAVVFSAYLLYDLKRIIDGGETNYITATLAVYLDVYNIFSSLLHLFTAFGGSDD